jgi:hypothetical protein
MFGSCFGASWLQVRTRRNTVYDVLVLISFDRFSTTWQPLERFFKNKCFQNCQCARTKRLEKLVHTGYNQVLFDCVDYVIRMVTMALKSLVVIVHKRILPFKNRVRNNLRWGVSKFGHKLFPWFRTIVTIQWNNVLTFYFTFGCFLCKIYNSQIFQ